MKRISNKISIRERGITLVALVITVIILLILAGVTVTTALGQNGLFKRAKLAKEEYEVATEKDALGLTVIAYKMNREEKDANNEKIGITLYDRNLDNGKNWNIVVENKNHTIYGTDWNYIEKGTEVQGYGRTKYNWVVNYETGETIRLEDESYANWNYKKTVAVTDNLLLNLDSANVGEIKESWGKDTKLYYYDADIYDTMEKRKDAYEKQKGKDVTNDNIGYDRQISDNIENYLDRDKGTFKFSGNNYLELFNDEGYDFSKGLTFEFYGMWSKGTWTFGNGRTEENINEVAEGPLFALWNGKHNELGAVRFRSEHIGFDDSYFLYSLGGSSAEFSPEDYGDFAEKNDLHNQRCYIKRIRFELGLLYSFD